MADIVGRARDDTTMDLTELTADLRIELDARMAARERGLTESRKAIRSCGNAIRALHRHEVGGALRLLEEAQTQVDEARRVLADFPDVLHAGFVHDAEKELAEARITFALVSGAGIPSHKRLGVPAIAYLKGMAEAIGELRRHILDLMRRGELRRGEELLEAMDDMYYLLTSMDYPDGLTLGLRRLTDVARSIIERTRGDFTVSVVQGSLRRALEDHATRLDDDTGA
ncbi:haloacid dehalogenase [soil metagenome]